MTKKTENRGGYRVNSGRKPDLEKIETKPVSGRISLELAELMKTKGYTAKEVLEWAIPIITKKGC